MRTRSGAELTVAYCEEKANVVLGCGSGNRSSRAQEAVCPPAQRGRDLGWSRSLPGCGKHILGNARSSRGKPSENKNHHGARKT